MRERVAVISNASDYVSQSVVHQLSSLGKGLEVVSITVDQLENKLTGKWDYAILLNQSIDPTDSCLQGKVMRSVKMEFPSPMNDEECDKIDATIRRRIIEFYLNDIEGREMLGADSCGAFCDL